MIICAPTSPAKSIASSVRRERASSRTASSGEREPALAEARVEVHAARDAVDAVPVERGAHLVEVVARELLRVVELVVVHQVAEALDGRPHLRRGRRLPANSGL